MSCGTGSTNSSSPSKSSKPMRVKYSWRSPSSMAQRVYRRAGSPPCSVLMLSARALSAPKSVSLATGCAFMFISISSGRSGSIFLSTRNSRPPCPISTPASSMMAKLFSLSAPPTPLTG